MNRIPAMIITLALLSFPAAAATDTTFTYQGDLQEAGSPANGSYTMIFDLWDALAGGSQVGSSVFIIGVPVTDGLFTVELDFGADVFDGNPLWLEINVDSTTLSPRQPITSAPYAIQTRGIFVGDNDNVGIGTTTPGALLEVTGDAEEKAIFGNNTATTGFNYGVWGESASTSGTGVRGWASAPTGLTYGVAGNAVSSTGIAVYGSASSTSGANYGGYFRTGSTSGIGAYGRATASSGETYGLFGESAGNIGRGVFGQATSSGGLTNGGRFEAASSSGRGVFAHATATNGFTYGAFGQVDSPDGIGVYGVSTATTGLNHGVYGRNASTDGIGVYGVATADTGENYGVYGETESEDGYAVYGVASTVTDRATYGGYFVSNGESGAGVRATGVRAGVSGESTATSSIAWGVYGSSESTLGNGVRGEMNSTIGNGAGVSGQTVSATGHGVFGLASHGSGVNYGVLGRSTSTSGRGVYGHATSNSGVPIAVYGVCDSFTGYDFYADGNGVNYGATSSRRWKNDIRNIDQPLDKLALLRGVYFNWDKAHGGHHDLGMIAEEVGKVLPEVVQYEANGIDASGMDYSKLTPLLVEAVNALRDENDALRAEKDAEIDALTQRISDLERLVARLATQAAEGTP